MDHQNLSAPACAQISPPRASDLEVATRIGRRMLAAYGNTSGYDLFAYAQAHGGLAEALRILLRALDTRAGNSDPDMDEALRRVRQGGAR